jgi:hypothetical protein
MKRVRIVGLCLIAAATSFAVAATGAQATPGSLAFGKCVAKAGGTFSNPGCTKIKAGTNAYEWEPVSAPVAFTTAKKTGTTNYRLETASGVEISCTTEKSVSGAITGAKAISGLALEMTGCKALGCECPCEPPRGQEATHELIGEPGIITKNSLGKEEKDLVGLELRSEAGVFLETSCGPAPVIVRGAVIVPWATTKATEVNRMLNKIELVFKAEKPGKQVPERFEGGPNAFLEFSANGAAFESAGLSLTTILKTTSTAIKVELRHCEKNVC